MQFTEDLISSFDNVSIVDDIDCSQYTTSIDSSFDMNTMQFFFTMNLLDENNKVVDSYSQISDAFVTEYGTLDAYVEVDGTQYLLSDLREQMAQETDECFWGWFAAIVAIVVVVYVIVAETAEQIKCRENYEYNKQLEASGNGVNKGNYITNQRQKTKIGYKSGNYRFGYTTFSDVGCEVASVYNLLISLNRAEMLSTTIYNFEKWCIEFAFAWGHFGSDPLEIGRYLKKYGINYTSYLSYSSFKSALASKSNCHIIMSTWNQSGISGGLHTYYIHQINNPKLNSYNFKYSDNYLTHPNIDEIKNNTGSFIISYII